MPSWPVRRILTGQRGGLLVALGFLGLLTGALIVMDGFGPFKFSWFALLYAWFLVVTLLYRDTWVTWFLRLPILGFFGAIAYGLYLYHQAISGMLHGWVRSGAEPAFDGAESIQVTLLAFGLSTLVAWGSFRFFEMPFLRVGRRFRYEDPVVESPAVAVAETQS